MFGGDEFWVISLNFLFPSSKSCGSHGWAFVWMSFGSLFPSHNFLFWSDELWKLKIHLGVFSFQNSVFNDIFVIRPTYPAAIFEKWIFFFFGETQPQYLTNSLIFFFFFWGETQPQLLKLKTGFELRCETGGLGNWGILSDEWWKLCDDKLQTKRALTIPL